MTIVSNGMTMATLFQVQMEHGSPMARSANAGRN